MSWHRHIVVHKNMNRYIHYLLEGYDNLGIVTTKKKETDFLVLEFSTPLAAAPYLDRIIDQIINHAALSIKWQHAEH